MYIAAPMSLLQTNSAPAAKGTASAGPGGSRRRRPPAQACAGCRRQKASSAPMASTAADSAPERIMRALLPLDAAYPSKPLSQDAPGNAAPCTARKHTALTAADAARAPRPVTNSARQAASTSSSKQNQVKNSAANMLFAKLLPMTSSTAATPYSSPAPR